MCLALRAAHRILRRAESCFARHRATEQPEILASAGTVDVFQHRADLPQSRIDKSSRRAPRTAAATNNQGERTRAASSLEGWTDAHSRVVGHSPLAVLAVRAVSDRPPPASEGTAKVLVGLTIHREPSRSRAHGHLSRSPDALLHDRKLVSDGNIEVGPSPTHTGCRAGIGVDTTLPVTGDPREYTPIRGHNGCLLSSGPVDPYPGVRERRKPRWWGPARPHTAARSASRGCTTGHRGDPRQRRPRPRRLARVG